VKPSFPEPGYSFSLSEIKVPKRPAESIVINDPLGIVAELSISS